MTPAARHPAVSGVTGNEMTIEIDLWPRAGQRPGGSPKTR